VKKGRMDGGPLLSFFMVVSGRRNDRSRHRKFSHRIQKIIMDVNKLNYYINIIHTTDTLRWFSPFKRGYLPSRMPQTRVDHL
jgi:hypothetical protein